MVEVQSRFLLMNKTAILGIMTIADKPSLETLIKGFNHSLKTFDC
jgi:hypothetical protein